MKGTPRLVTLNWEDLISGQKDLSSEIYEAYGPGGLGALTIAGIPDYVCQREQLLALSHPLAHLPDNIKAGLEHEPSMYNAGWSHGKEKLGDKPDYAKGSFYGNPLYDVAADDEMIEKYPFFFPKNIWPSEHLPELESAFKTLGQTMYSATLHLARHIDTLTLRMVPSYEPGYLESHLSSTHKVKGRLLYYYPIDTEQDLNAEDAWIGWHNDSGFLTALTSDIYVNDDTGEVVQNPDPQGGLWVVTRDGGSVRVEIPKDHLAVQCGECLQILTGGLLVATPHAVRASKAPPGLRVGRASFPVFVDVGPDFPLSAPEGVSREQVFAQTIDSRVPPLEDRWLAQGTPFVTFLGDTFRKYYAHQKALLT